VILQLLVEAISSSVLIAYSDQGSRNTGKGRIQVCLVKLNMGCWHTSWGRCQIVEFMGAPRTDGGWRSKFGRYVGNGESQESV
jgi:hypothetical protein